ncbi:MAG: NAD(P)H-binding protein [Bacteroidota bacterium]
MRILLLGATGRTGRHVLEQALKDGYSINAIVREESKVKVSSPHLRCFQGDVLDYATLSGAANGCDAVISVLNVARTSDFPWSKLRTPEYFVSDFMRVMITVCREQNIRRIITCSAWGVLETKKRPPGMVPVVY